MIDRLDKSRCPSLEEMGEYVGNPLFSQFCAEVKDRYQCAERIEFSACSMEKGYVFASAKVEMVPQNYVALSDEGDIKNMEKLIDNMEDNDDVQNVWHNWDN